MKNLIIIEKNSLFINFILFFFSKKNTLIYYFHPYQIDQYKKFINKIKRFQEFTLPHETEQSITYKANKEALKILDEKNTEKIANFFANIGIPKEILIAFRKYQLIQISYQIRIAHILDYINSQISYEFKIYCFMSNRFDFKYSKEFQKSKKNINFYNINIVSLFSQMWITIISLFYIPFFIILKILKNGLIFSQVVPKRYKFGFHFNNNVYNRNTYTNKNSFTVSRSDFYLSKMLNYKDNESIYIYSHWNFNSEEKKRNIKEIRSRGAHLGYEYDNPINLKVLKITFKYYFNLLKLVTKQIYTNDMSFLDLITINRIIRDLVICEIFCSNYKIYNFISRDDYSPIHISRTITFNKYNLNNNGIAHSCCQENHTTMTLSYTYFKTYFTQGHFYYEDVHKKNWFSKNHISIGPIYSPLIEDSLKDKKKHDKFIEEYGNKKKICYLIGAFNSEECPFDSRSVNLDSQNKLLDLMKLDSEIIIFIVPRNKNSVEELLQSFDQYEKYKDRIFIDFFYSTYDLMAYCNYLITEAISSSIFEGTANPELSIIPFNSRAITVNPLYNYKDIKVFETTFEIYNEIKNQISNEEEFIINNTSIKKLI